MLRDEVKYASRMLASGLELLLLLASSTWAQSPGARVSGTVHGTKTGRPLRDANVFLANTMLGSSTNERGVFTITGIPSGSYELVVSHVGYVLKKQFIRLNPGDSVTVALRLAPKIITAPDIEVTAPRAKTWKRQLEYFEDAFLGTSKNASKCTITNPEILDFQGDPAKKQFIARANGTLIIENDALGYRIHYLLEEFGIKQGLVKYMGFPRFERLTPRNPKQQKQWRKNRLRTYRGSQRHFLASFLAGDHEKNGFLVQAVAQLPVGEEIIAAYDVSPDSLVTSGRTTFQKQLSFSNFLQVTYTRAKEAPEYLNWIAKQSGITRNDRTFFIPKAQTSWIKMNQYFAQVDTSGNVANPFAFTVYGYWAWRRVADMLPFEYRPERR